MKLEVQQKPPLSIVSDKKKPLYFISLGECKVKNIPQNYEKHVLETLTTFSEEERLKQKNLHKLKGKNNLYSLDVKSRVDKYRMLFRKHDDDKCIITEICTDETHKG